MERLVQKNINTSEEYDRIFLERLKKGVDSQDVRRWKSLLKYYKGGSVAEIGCLDSLIPEMVLRKFPDAEVFGIDIAATAIQTMQNRYPNAKFEVRDLYDTKFEENRFDYTILGEVIEHLEKPAEAIKEAVRITKKGGIVALSTPLEEGREPGAVDHERHLWSFNLSDIMNMLKPYGKVRTATIGSQYFPEYVYHFPSILAWCKKQ